MLKRPYICILIKSFKIIGGSGAFTNDKIDCTAIFIFRNNISSGYVHVFMFADQNDGSKKGADKDSCVVKDKIGQN